MTSTWKDDFSEGERFKIKGHVFTLTNVGKRSIFLRHETETNGETPQSPAEQKTETAEISKKKE